MISKTDWAYAAGIVDGEGCIAATTKGSGTKTFAVRCRVRQRNPKAIHFLRDTFPGKYQEWGNSYAWEPGGRKRTKYFLIGILPYLTVKKSEALVALKMIRVLELKPLGHRRSEREYLLLARLNSRLQELKR